MKSKLILLLIICAIALPTFGHAKNAEVSSVTFENSEPKVESMLLTEFKTRTNQILLSEASSISVILQFDSELTSNQIQWAEAQGIDFVTRGGSVVHVGQVYSAMASSLDAIRNLNKIGLLQAASGSKQYYPSLPSSVSAIDAPNVWYNLRENRDSINGTGTRIAVIDTGASWLHPTFWRRNSEELDTLQSGSRFYVDLDSDSTIDANEGPISTVDGQLGSNIDYEDDYMFIDINDDGRFQYGNGERWLGGIDSNEDGEISLTTENVVVLGESKVAFLFDQENDDVYVRGVNLTQATNVGDSYGHGTHVASTAAGGQIGMTSYVGVAPDADLIIIKSPLDSASIIEGIHFAVENDADVINMSFSSYLGFLDGTDLEDLAVSQAFIANGTMSTLAAGNLGGRSKHASFQCDSGETAGTTLSVNNPPDNSFINLLWQSEDDNEHVILTPPGGAEPIDIGEFGAITGSAYSLDADNISVYVFPDTSTRGTNRLIIQVSAPDHFWDSGTWIVSLENPSGESVMVDAYAWDTQWHYTNLRFTSRVDNRRTISSPGTADFGVAVASYSENGDTISSTSSKGPRIDGYTKPEVSAPGEIISAARNSLTSLWTSKSGTSMASPHVAGVLALIRQASNSMNGWLDLSSLFQGAGGAEDHYESPSYSWGYGLVSPVYAIQHFLDTGINKTYWDSIASLADDPIDSGLNGSLDMVNVKINQNTTAFQFKVDFAAEVDFSTDSVFSIEWDTDSSFATGPSGVDLLVNISSGNANAYQWTDSHFEIAEFTPQWFTELNSLYISLPRPQGPSRGRAGFRTSNSSLATADFIDYSNLENQWGCLFEDVSYEAEGTIYDIHLEIYDRDTTLDELGLQANAVDGALDTLASQNVDDVDSLDWEVDIEELGGTTLLSIQAIASDESTNLKSPPVLLSAELGTEVNFVSATLERDEVRVGPFISDRISGLISIEGHMFVNDVSLSFRRQQGFSPNVTLSGSNGEYTFDISTSGFSVGEYTVVAVALLRTGEEISHEFATLRVVSDYSVVTLLGVIAIAIVVVVLIYPRLSSRLR